MPDAAGDAVEKKGRGEKADGAAEAVVKDGRGGGTDPLGDGEEQPAAEGKDRAPKERQPEGKR